MTVARLVSNLLTALSFFAFAGVAAAQVSVLFPLDHFRTHALDAPLAAAPAADGRHIYLPLQTGRFTAFDAARGDAAWSVELAATAAPLAAEDRVFVPASGAIHALDAATGSVVWRLPAGDLAAPLAYRGGWLIVALADGGLQGVRAADGTVLWGATPGAALAAAPSLDGDALAAALVDGRLLLIDVRTGSTIWTRTLGAPARGVTLSGDRVFAGTANGFFWSLKTRSGDIDWRWRLGAPLIGAPAADADGVYAVAVDNVVRGFRRGSGNQRWSLPLTTRALAGPALVDGLLVLSTGEVGRPGLVYIRPDTGAAAGRTPALPDASETMRMQHPAIVTAGPAPIAVIATATTGGDWAIHAYRQTFIPVSTGALTWGPSYEIRWRLEIATGVRVFGTTVPLVPLVPRVPSVPQVRF